MSTSDNESDSEVSVVNMFAEPEDYYPPSPPPTTATHTLLSGRTLTLRLIGHNPLWGHLLWNAGRIISHYLERNAFLLKDATVLELGAGAGLPSLVSSLLGAARVVVTDYPDPDLIQNLAWNIEHCLADASSSPDASANLKEIPKDVITPLGYCWGADTTPLLSPLASSPSIPSPKFDILILADLLFNHSEHAKLLSTIQLTLSHAPSAKALVFFTPYRPWLLEKDLAFFDLCRKGGMSVEKVLEEKMEAVMFEEDRGDEELRRTVFGYIVRWEGEGEEKVETLNI